jgi:hypothetical protein
MLIRHPTSGLFWSVTDTCELSLSKEGSDYVKSTCGVPPHVATWDQNTSHLKNTVTGKCVCRMGDKLVEAVHGGIANGLFEWTIVDGMVQNFQGSFVDGDLSLVDKTSVQWHMADSFEEDVPVDSVSAPVEEEDVPVPRGSALIEEALNARGEEPESDEEAPGLVNDAEETSESDEDVPGLVSDAEEPEVTPEIEQVIAETVADVLAPIEEAQATPEEAAETPASVKKPSASE